MADALPNVEHLIGHLTTGLRALFKQRGITDPAFVGIHTGGVWIAERLHAEFASSKPLAMLDISFYRDDFSRIGMSPQVRPSHLSFGVDNQHIVLVDDVLYTGRTIRAALNEIFDYGRPASVIFVALVDRGGRELPIQPDVVGAQLNLAPQQHLKLKGPTPLTLAFAENE